MLRYDDETLEGTMWREPHDVLNRSENKNCSCKVLGLFTVRISGAARGFWGSILSRRIEERK